MKYSEAIKIARKNPEFVEALKKNEAQEFTFCMRFVVGNECFYYSREFIYNEATEQVETLIEGGKYSASRSTYLISRGKFIKVD